MDDSNKNLTDLGSRKISSLLAKLAIPATIGITSATLYNIVDTIFIGRGVGTLAIAALGIVFPMWMIVMALAQLIGMGSASVLSRSLGKKDYERAYTVTGNSFLLVLILGIVCTAVVLIFLDPILILFGATENIMPYARDYLFITSFGFIYFPFIVASNNLIRSEGNARAAMSVMIVATGLNIVLDPIFIFALDMGIKGAAYATIISQFIGFVYVVYYFASGKSSLSPRLRHFKLNFSIVKEITKLGFASFIRQASFSLLTIIINNALKVQGGDLSIAIYSVINRIIMFITMPMFGIVGGVQPIIAFNYGAKKFDRVKQSVRLSVVVSTIIGIVFFLAIMIFPSQTIGIFSKDINLVKNGVLPIRTIIILYPLIGFQTIGASFFQSIGRAAPSILLSMSRQVLFLIPLVLILPIFWGITGIWISFPIADLLAVILTAVFLRREFNRISLASGIA